MNASLRALLQGIVDYAGLFPPARLPLDQAIRNYALFRSQDEARMLGRFICPVGKLADLETYCPALFSNASPLALSVLPIGGATAAEFLTQLDADLKALSGLRDRQRKQISIEVLELKLPADLLNSGESLTDFLERLTAGCREYGFPALTPFCEMALGANWATEVSRTLESLSRFNGSRTGGQPRAGFKLRCGGLEKAAFPSVEQVALVLQTCTSHGVPFKATAGLHHPLRRFDPQLQATMHGFINVFGAGVLGAVHGLDPSLLQAILADDQPGHFRFSDDALQWCDYAASFEDIVKQRLTLLTSFGSCSFDEPRDDLRALGWL